MMKKISLIIATITFFANYSSAQDEKKDYRNRLTFGLKAGMNSSNVYDEQGEDFRADPKLGLAVGAFIAIPINEIIGVQPEILISQKGFQGSGRIAGDPYSFTRTTTYLDIPLLFAIKPVNFLTIVAGPQFSYLLNQRDVFHMSSFSSSHIEDFENDNIRKNTLCLTFGADINIGHFVIGARAGWDVMTNSGTGFSETPRYKNVWVQGTFGVRF